MTNHDDIWNADFDAEELDPLAITYHALRVAIAADRFQTMDTDADDTWHTNFGRLIAEGRDQGISDVDLIMELAGIVASFAQATAFACEGTPIEPGSGQDMLMRSAAAAAVELGAPL